MHLKKSLFCYFIIFFVMIQWSAAQQNFYDINTIQKIEIYFDYSNWDYRLDTANAAGGNYIKASWIKVNKTQIFNVGVKYKGNSSFDSTYTKNPLHIALDEYTDQAYQTYTDIKLGNNYADPSMIREVLSYDILKNYMHCPKSNFAELYINGNFIGLYSNDESINKDFCSTHFSSSENTFVKCNPLLNPGPNTKSNLKFSTSDSANYFNFYEIKSDHGWYDLVNLCDSITNNPASIATMFNLDRVLWMLAFNNVMVNLDSYSGVFCQNYYLYKDNTGQYNPVIWDLNMSLGGFPYAGNLNTSMGSLTIANMQQLPVSLHAMDPHWPLINAVMANASYKKMYIAHMRSIVNDFFANGNYITRASEIQTIIDAAVLTDTNKFFTDAQFQSGLTANNAVGNYQVPGISNLMNARVSYLQSTAEFVATPPTVSVPVSNNNMPDLNSLVTISTNVINANEVILNYRYNNENNFTQVLMYDDGIHDDGLAGDGIFATSVDIRNSMLQYYVYAENNLAGIFSPDRAAHQFYTLITNLVLPSKGDAVLNELLATNENDVTTETNKHSDWIELYNTTLLPINLFGLFISDNYTVPHKFAFNENAIIPAKGYFTLWADEGLATAFGAHCNFKLSGSGEQLILSDVHGNVLDSISFGTQVADVSLGRCPDGSGSFVENNIASFDGANCSKLFSEELFSIGSPIIYPNPANSLIKIEPGRNLNKSFEIFNQLGALTFTGVLSYNTTIDTQHWTQGVYLFRTGSTAKKIIVYHH